MFYRDWLYIPRSDKQIIFLLLGCIFCFSLLNFILSKIQQNDKIENTETVVEIGDVGMHYTYVRQTKKKEGNSKGDKIDLNLLTIEDLFKIPQIDSVFIPRIISYRSLIRGYVSTSQLIEVMGLDSYTQHVLESYVCVESEHDSIYINQESFRSLLQHPYLNYKQCLVIDDLRTRKGHIKTIKRLGLLEEFSKWDIERLKPYISFTTNKE